MRRVSSLHGLFPAGKVHCAGKGREHDELREGEFRLLRHSSRGGKCGGTITGQAEDERAQDVNIMPAEFAQTVNQVLVRQD